MTIYAEILFAENFISGMVILILTGKISGKSTKKWRIIAGSVMCGVYAFVLFVPLHWLVSLTAKMMFSLAVTWAVFDAGTWRGLLKTAGVFYIASFLTGGVTIAMMYMVKFPGITANGSVYMQMITYLKIATGLAAAWLLGSWMASAIRERIYRDKVLCKVKIYICGHMWDIRALSDTGNSLREPVSGKPVAIVSKTVGRSIVEQLEDKLATRTCLIPYKSVGNTGLMQGIRPDCIIDGDGDIIDVVIGISEKDFAPWMGYEKYDLLLHQQFFKGEE